MIYSYNNKFDLSLTRSTLPFGKPRNIHNACIGK